ncbi:MAG: cyclic nucleotide-binding domain-containing protein [Hyphomicrobiales bacterium]|nr:cyclic nucleotide-binding domain-containing protein [Hyphomicrobiales bacterium]
MKTMVPLRILGLCSNVAFITYGFLEDLHPVLILHSILLPLNAVRLHQMLRLTRDVREAAFGDLNMGWLKSYGSVQHARDGEVLFSKGDVADSMFVVVSGRYRLENGTEITAPHVIGEFALLAPDRRRTQAIRCVAAGTLLRVSYGDFEQLFFQNPKFGFYFLHLVTRRLFENVEQLEAERTRHRPATNSPGR